MDMTEYKNCEYLDLWLTVISTLVSILTWKYKVLRRDKFWKKDRLFECQNLFNIEFLKGKYSCELNWNIK